MKNHISKHLLLYILLLVLLGSKSTLAGNIDVETPEVLDGVTIVSVSKVQSLMNDNSITILDVRNPINYGRGHIPGAVVAPYSGTSSNIVGFDSSKDKLDLSEILLKQGQSVIVYSHGSTGWKSYKASKKLKNMGMKVYWFRNGLSKWQEKGLSIK